MYGLKSFSWGGGGVREMILIAGLGWRRLDSLFLDPRMS